LLPFLATREALVLKAVGAAADRLHKDEVAVIAAAVVVTVKPVHSQQESKAPARMVHAKCASKTIQATHT
jgi:hypothetical protein